MLAPPELLTSSTIKGFIKQNWHFQRVTATRQYFFLSQMWIYSKSLLTGISVNSTFWTAFDFKKINIVCRWDIYYFCYDYKHLPSSNKPYQPEIKFIGNKYLPAPPKRYNPHYKIPPPKILKKLNLQKMHHL